MRKQKHDTAGMIDSLNNLGVVLSSIGDHDGAVSRFREVLGLLGESSDGAKRVRCLLNLGRAMAEGGQPARALDVFHEALDRARSSAILREEAESYMNIGAAHLKLGEVNPGCCLTAETLNPKPQTLNPKPWLLLDC